MKIVNRIVNTLGIELELPGISFTTKDDCFYGQEIATGGISGALPVIALKVEGVGRTQDNHYSIEIVTGPLKPEESSKTAIQAVAKLKAAFYSEGKNSFSKVIEVYNKSLSIDEQKYKLKLNEAFSSQEIINNGSGSSSQQTNILLSLNDFFNGQDEEFHKDKKTKDAISFANKITAESGLKSDAAKATMRLFLYSLYIETMSASGQSISYTKDLYKVYPKAYVEDIIFSDLTPDESGSMLDFISNKDFLTAMGLSQKSYKKPVCEKLLDIFKGNLRFRNENPEYQLKDSTEVEVSDGVHSKQIDTILGRDRNNILEIRKKKTRLSSIYGAVFEIRDSSHHYNSLFLGKFTSSTLTPDSALNQKWTNLIDKLPGKNAGTLPPIGLTGEDDIYEELSWSLPEIEEFKRYIETVDSSEKSTEYNKNLIIQLQSAEGVNDSVLNLFGKHPEQSALLQLDPDNKSLNVLLWDNETKDFRISSIADWLTLDSEGMIRIQLVGHGDTKEGKTTLGGLDVAQLQQAIHPVLEQLAKSGPHLKGLKISLVGCETLPAGGSLEQSLPAQLLQFIHNQLQQLELKDVPLQLTGRELQIQVNNDGHKLVNIDGKWVSKEVANLLGKQHKTTLLMQEGQVVVQAKSKGEVLALIEGMQAIKEPLSADDAALLGKIGASLQESIREVSGERHEQQTTQLLIQLNELLLLKGEVNGIFDDLLLNYPELKGFKPTLETDKAGNLIWIGENNEKKPILIESQQHEKIARLNKHMQQLLNDFQMHASLDGSGNISLKHDEKVILEQMEGNPATLNAAFLLQTLLGENPFNKGLDNVTMAMKVQTYTQLIQNVQGGVQDLVEVSDMVLKAIATDFQLASKLIGVFKSLGNLLDLINLGTSIAQVAQAKNAYEQGMAITNLVGAVVPLSMTIISLASTALGAAAVANFINPLTIPLAGLLIGGSALVSIELKDKAAYQYATDLFKHLLDDYNKSKDVEWSEIVNSTLVIQSVNLLDGVIELGKATATEATWGTAVVDIYKAFGVNEKSTNLVGNTKIVNADAFVLPSNLAANYNYQLQSIYGLWTPEYSEAFERLHQKYGDQFEWFKHHWFMNDYINIRSVEYKHTDIVIVLDKRERNIIMPVIDDEIHRNKLCYNLKGSGGHYTLSMSHLPIDLVVNASTDDKESWFFDVSHLINSVLIDNGKVVETKFLRFAKDRVININSDRLTIGSQSIRFDGKVRPKNVCLVSDLAMISDSGDLVGGISGDKHPLSGRIIMQIDLSEQKIVNKVLSFDSYEEMVQSIPYMKRTLTNLDESRYVQLVLKGSNTNGVFDSSLNRGIFLNSDTGILSYFDNGSLVAEKAVARLGSKELDAFLGGRDSVELICNMDGVYLHRTLITCKMAKATITSQVRLDDDGIMRVYTDTVSLSKESFSMFERLVLQGKDPLIGLAKLFGPLFEDDWLGVVYQNKSNKQLITSLERYRESAYELNFTGNERIYIEGNRGQKMAFEYDAAKNCMQMKSAIWTRSGFNFNYNFFLGQAYFSVNGNAKLLDLRGEDSTIDYVSPETILVIGAGKNTGNILLPTANNKFKQIVINSASDSLSLDVGGFRANRYGLMYDGQDLIICAEEQPQIRITNAWNINKLQLGISGDLFEVDKPSIWAKQEKLHNLLASQFGLEPIYGEYEIGAVRYFNGESGVQYKMIGKECSAVGYIGKEDLILPKNGIRSLELLKNILAGQTLFSGKGDGRFSMDAIFHEKGQEALNLLAALESGDVKEIEYVKIIVLERIHQYKAFNQMHGIINPFLEKDEKVLLNEVFDRAKSMVSGINAQHLAKSSSMLDTAISTSYHLEKLVMAMNSMAGLEVRGEGERMFGNTDLERPVQLALMH